MSKQLRELDAFSETCSATDRSNIHVDAQVLQVIPTLVCRENGNVESKC
jgi:hypothetical protein